MSPKTSRANQRRQRNLLISVLAVVAISLGSFAAVFSAKWSPKLGLDLAGGLAVVYQTQHKVSQSELQETVNILNSRVNGLGVSGAQVATSGTDEVSVSIPGVSNAAAVLATIGQTAQLYFRPVLVRDDLDRGPQAGRDAVQEEHQTRHGHFRQRPAADVCPLHGHHRGQSRCLAFQPERQRRLPRSAVLLDHEHHHGGQDYPNRTVLLPQIAPNGTASTTAPRYVMGPEQMTGHAIGSAQAQQDQTGNWVVNYTLAGSANSALWDKVAQENFHALLGIELDGNVYSAPLIQPGQAAFSSFDGQGQISGNLTQANADQLAQAMQFGSLPVTLKQLTTQTVSPTLGKSALLAGLSAGVAGLALVLLYVLVYYRGLGLVVISGLALTAALLWAIISALGHTSFSPSFDLAGITGLIVSIGITVDSYIVYFERLKDETRSGRSVRTSVDRGFKSAWRTVWAADFVSLLAAIVLYVVAVGTSRGSPSFSGSRPFSTCSSPGSTRDPWSFSSAAVTASPGPGASVSHVAWRCSPRPGPRRVSPPPRGSRYDRAR